MTRAKIIVNNQTFFFITKFFYQIAKFSMVPVKIPKVNFLLSYSFKLLSTQLSWPQANIHRTVKVKDALAYNNKENNFWIEN